MTEGSGDVDLVKLSTLIADELGRMRALLIEGGASPKTASYAVLWAAVRVARPEVAAPAQVLFFREIASTIEREGFYRGPVGRA